MAHYALVKNGIVQEVVVAEQDIIDHLQQQAGFEGQYVQTSYNTREGVHFGPDGEPDGGIPLRKNFAGIGYTYDSQADAFYPPCSFAGWLLDTEKGIWQPPIPHPTDGKTYSWNNFSQSWVEWPYITAVE
jgi:hypothetical protein